MSGDANEELTFGGPSGRIMTLSRPSPLWTRVTAAGPGSGPWAEDRVQRRLAEDLDQENPGVDGRHEDGEDEGRRKPEQPTAGTGYYKVTPGSRRAQRERHRHDKSKEGRLFHTRLTPPSLAEL